MHFAVDRECGLWTVNVHREVVLDLSSTLTQVTAQGSHSANTERSLRDRVMGNVAELYRRLCLVGRSNDRFAMFGSFYGNLD